MGILQSACSSTPLPLPETTFNQDTTHNPTSVLPIPTLTPEVDPRMTIARDFIQAIIDGDAKKVISKLPPDYRQDPNLNSNIAVATSSLAGCQIQADATKALDSAALVKFKNPCGVESGNNNVFTEMRVELISTPNGFYINNYDSKVTNIENNNKPVPTPIVIQALKPKEVNQPSGETIQLGYFEKCPDCGGNFTVDKIEQKTTHFRIHINITNTGEQGDLRLFLNKSSVFVLNQQQAETYKNSLVNLKTPDQIHSSFTKLPRVTMELEKDASLPAILRPNENWDGWLKSLAPLSNLGYFTDMIVYLDPLIQSNPKQNNKASTWWTSLNYNKPFISVRPHYTPSED